MKTILAISILFVLVGCHPPETTIIKINAVDGSTNDPLDSLRCQVLEKGAPIAEKYTQHGQTQMAFEMRSNLSYELQIDAMTENKMVQVQHPGYHIILGQTNEFDVKFLRYGFLSLSLETLVNTTSNDFLEYQLVNLDYNEIYPVSNGWDYGEADIYGPQYGQHFVTHEMPAGNYRLDYRVRRNGYYSTSETYISIQPELTTDFLLQY